MLSVAKHDGRESALLYLRSTNFGTNQPNRAGLTCGVSSLADDIGSPARLAPDQGSHFPTRLSMAWPMCNIATWPESLCLTLRSRCCLHLAAFDHCYPIVYTCLAENAVKMVLDRTF